VLAILTTHPIQYQVPLWRALGARGNVPFRVFYMSAQGLEPRFDPGFGQEVASDLDLLSGYNHEFIDVFETSRQASFGWLILKPGFGARLESRGATILWIQGWQVAAYWQAIWSVRRKDIEIWVRGDTNLASSRQSSLSGLKSAIRRQAFRRLDRFLHVGENNRRFYLSEGVDSDALFFAPHCVDNERFARQSEELRPRRRDLRAQWCIPDDAFCILFAGKFVPKKRPLDLPAAVAQLQTRHPDRKVHILWAGSGELGPILRNSCNVRFDGEGAATLSREPDERPAASFTGFLNQNEITKAYVASDCLVLPSEASETWGLVVNEAMASGLPCIVSNACGCAEDLVTPINREFCFPVGSIEALQRALLTMMERPPVRSALRSRIDRYHQLRTVETIETLYVSAEQTR
jgi:glycosyltransferase involved in cell wall biosynthesis